MLTLGEEMKLSEFQYELPNKLIARYPTAERSQSRLLCINKTTEKISHHIFSDIVEMISPHDLLICNDTKVIPARLFGKKPTGGQVEILIERLLENNRCLAHIRASKSPKPDTLIFLKNDITLKVIQRHENLFELTSEKNILEIIEALGEIPLPPYFERQPEESDKERYQTIFAKHKGSVAAPTAGLHFDEKTLQALQKKGVEIAYLTLHVGAGTFAPVRIEDITQHQMHAEYLEISEEICDKIKACKARGGKVIAVGTTSARSLETAAINGEIKPYRGDTKIFIYPGFQFKCVDALITNFHLPGSTLLMLVSAFANQDLIKKTYQEAIDKHYRFFSYGDAMFIYAI